MVEQLILNGADIIKVGIGPGEWQLILIVQEGGGGPMLECENDWEVWVNLLLITHTYTFISNLIEILSVSLSLSIFINFINLWDCLHL